jgi:hypothetical protein
VTQTLPGLLLKEYLIFDTNTALFTHIGRSYIHAWSQAEPGSYEEPTTLKQINVWIPCIKECKTSGQMKEQRRHFFFKLVHRHLFFYNIYNVFGVHKFGSHTFNNIAKQAKFLLIRKKNYAIQVIQNVRYACFSQQNITIRKCI